MTHFFSRPESVAEQKARLAREYAAAQAKKAREEIARRAAAPITGRPVDTTGDLFNQAAAAAPLFATLVPQAKDRSIDRLALKQQTMGQPK